MRALSTCSVLEKILQAFRRRRERANIEKSVTAYYSSLTDKEVREQAKWGELAADALMSTGCGF